MIQDNFTLNIRHQCHKDGCMRHIEGDYSDKWCWEHHETEEGVIVTQEDI